MEKAGFLDRIGRDNVCEHIDAALARARVFLACHPRRRRIRCVWKNGRLKLRARN